VKEKRGGRHTQLLHCLKEARGYLKEEELGRTVWRTRFGRGYELLVRQTTTRMNKYEN